MTFEHPAPEDAPQQAHLLTVQQAIADGERGIRIPFGAPFACTFAQIQSGARSMVSDPLKEAPKQIWALAEGIRSSLTEVHQKLGHQVTYEIKEETLQLPNSDLASRFVAMVQVAGETLPKDVMRAVAERFFEEAFSAKYSLQEPMPDEIVFTDEMLQAFMNGGDYVPPNSATPTKRLEIADVEDVDGLLADAVAAPALDFARANAGKRVECMVVTPAGDFQIRGVAARPESKWKSGDLITLVRQIDGLAISDHKVHFAMPNHYFESNEDQYGNGPEAMPGKFIANIGKGEGSDVPPEPLLTQVREFIGSNTLLVRIRVEAIEVGGKVGYQLVHMEGEEPVLEIKLSPFDSQ
jgi:hypothetical protein